MHDQVFSFPEHALEKIRSLEVCVLLIMNVLYRLCRLGLRQDKEAKSLCR